MIARSDVLIAGSGPAGLVTGTLLARAGRTVTIVSRPRGRFRAVGETVGPELAGLFDELDLDGFDKVPGTDLVGRRVIWGSEQAAESSSVVNPLGAGRHLDRDAFDEWIREHAVASGVTFIERSLAEDDLAPDILATGRGGRHWRQIDRLVGVVGWLKPTGKQSRARLSANPEMTIETASNGWWYTAPLPDGGLVATFMTDSDLLQQREGSQLSDWWWNQLQATTMTAERCASSRVQGPVLVRRADSGWRPDCDTLPQFAVGDAAFARDPLTGQGIFRAVESGKRLAARLLPDEPIGLEDPGEELRTFLETRTKYYGSEMRYAEFPFWRRRHPVALEGMPIWLNPETRLQHAQGTGFEALDRAESLLTAFGIQEVARTAQSPRFAHELMGDLLQMRLPITPPQSLAGLQLLTMAGSLEFAGDDLAGRAPMP